jgi:hypothetical protein
MEIIINSFKYGKQIVVIDDEDFEKVKNYKWYPNRDHKRNNFYSVSSKQNKKIIMHRIIIDAKEGEIVDHINGDTLDNRKANLRICNHSQNTMNSKKPIKGITSNYKGVSLDQNKIKYRADIMHDGKHEYLGLFETADQAAIAYNIAAVKYFGEFARPNNNIMMHKGI